GTSQAALWEDFVATHCQVRLVIAGHEHSGDDGEASRTDANSCGDPVHQLMTDYQSRPNGGDGWLRYYTFDPAENTMTATTYSPKLDAFETDADSSFTLPFPLTPAVEAPFSPVATSTVGADGLANATWSGLDPASSYEWRAVIRSGGQVVASSPTWTFTTAAPIP